MREIDMNNGEFEVHPPGTAREVALSRELVHEIERITHQFGNVVPHSVMNTYQKLKEHYDTQDGVNYESTY